MFVTFVDMLTLIKYGIKYENVMNLKLMSALCVCVCNKCV